MYKFNLITLFFTQQFVIMSDIEAIIACVRLNHVMHLCPICNRRTINVLDDDDDDDDDDVN